MVIFGSPNTDGHSPKGRFVVIAIEVTSYSLLTRWNSSCPPVWAKGRYPSSSRMIRSRRLSWLAVRPWLPARASASR